MQEFTVKFELEKETPNTLKFKEVPGEGQPPRIGALYLQKWVAGGAKRVSVTVKGD